jgi:hypothetical protein
LAAPRAWTVDGGISWVPRPNVQWDVSSGVLVRGPGRSWFVSAGVTLRRLPRYMRSATDTRKAAFTGAAALDSAGTALTGATPRQGKNPICDRRRAVSPAAASRQA